MSAHRPIAFPAMLLVVLSMVLVGCRAGGPTTSPGLATTPSRPSALPCAVQTTATTQAWVRKQQVVGSIDDGPVTTLSQFVYPLGLPEEDRFGVQLRFIAWAPDARHLAVVAAVQFIKMGGGHPSRSRDWEEAAPPCAWHFRLCQAQKESLSMRHKRAYQYRCYPTPSQRHMLARTFGCARFVYNWGLRLRTDAYRQRGEHLFYSDTSAALTTLKQQEATAWLNEVSSVPPQQALRHLDKAFKNFFDGRAKYPTYKKKHGRQSAEYTPSAFTWDGKQLTLAKMTEPLPICLSRPLPEGARPTTITVTKDSAGRYFVSFLVEEEIQPLSVSPQTIGIDLGLLDVVTFSTGEKTGNEHFFRKEEKRLARLQRRHAKKQKSSKNREKARRKVARLHAHIADRRRDFAHKLTTRLIRENQVVCVESLAVKNLLQNVHLAKAIADVGWGELIRQLEYKAAWYGRTLVAIDRFFPSSKRCSVCDYLCETLDLDERQWTCPQCGTVHDRDTNAAVNIKAEGLSVLACGGAVSPNLNGNQGRHAPVKQEDSCREAGNPITFR